MQTFLPYPSFPASAAALDDRRLGKQRVETFQILRALVFPSYGWKHHPAVAMWRGFTAALVSYGLAACAEWERRGYTDAVAGSLLAFSGGTRPDPVALRLAGRLPPWLGDPELHASHRSALVRKEPADYRDFDEPPDLPYVWPHPLFPRWPIRRVGALPVDVAARQAGLAALADGRAPVLAAVGALAAGHDAGVADPAVALGVVLAAPPPAVWIVAGPDARADAAPTGWRPGGDGRRSGRPTASIARPPGPADVTATAEEAAADLGLVVHPEGRLADEQVRARLAALTPGVVVTQGVADLAAVRKVVAGARPVVVTARPPTRYGAPPATPAATASGGPRGSSRRAGGSRDG